MVLGLHAGTLNLLIFFVRKMVRNITVLVNGLCEWSA